MLEGFVLLIVGLLGASYCRKLTRVTESVQHTIDEYDRHQQQQQQTQQEPWSVQRLEEMFSFTDDRESTNMERRGKF